MIRSEGGEHGVQDIPRKRKRSFRHLPMILILVSAAALVVLLYALSRVQSQPQTLPEARKSGTRMLLSVAQEDVTRIRTELRDGDSWTVIRGEDGHLWDERGFVVDPTMEQILLRAASQIECVETVSEQTEQYASRLAEFGLVVPDITVQITYGGTREVELHIGDRFASSDMAYYYMTWTEDPGLYGIDYGTRQDFAISSAMLHSVPELGIQGSRVCRIELTRGEESLVWALDADIQDTNASDYWNLTSPFEYPADGTAMQHFLSALEALTFGAYEGPATEDTLAACGLDTPRGSLTVSLAAGMGTSVQADGSVQTTEFPAQTCTLVIGGTRGNFVDYVLYEHEIYRMSDLTLGPVFRKTAEETLSRYLVRTPADEVESLTIRDSHGREETYTIHSTIPDQGQETEKQVECQGSVMSYEAWAARYSRLEQVTVSGRLPEGWVPETGEKTEILIRDNTGRTGTIELCPMDATYDAVSIDGGAWVFYLPHGALEL